jgi:predicted Zn-dependent protease
MQINHFMTYVEKYDTPLVDATTPSLEALKAYSLGRKKMATEGDTAALPFFVRAIELDPNFAISGNLKFASADANAALKLAPNRYVREMAALITAQKGDTSAAEKMAAALDKDFPLDTLVQRYWLPATRAAIALKHKAPGPAVEVLQVSNAIELGQRHLVVVYLRGEAYLMLHDGSHAATEFQKFIDNRALAANSEWGALARLGLARAYAMQGDTTKARLAYQDFLTLWKDADQDLPTLISAKREYAALR